MYKARLDPPYKVYARASLEETSRVSKRININTAEEEDLVKLNGIGNVLAGRIISYRDETGHFTAKEDIMKVKGIGHVKFEKLKEQITIGITEP